MTINPPPPRPPTPTWVKVFGAVVAVLVTIFVGLHLFGLGFGHHMHGG
jgi:hypothetical protein